MRGKNDSVTFPYFERLWLLFWFTGKEGRIPFLLFSCHLSSSCLVHIRPSRSPSIYLNYPQRSSLPPTIAILLLLFPFQPFGPQVVFDLPILFPSGAQVISMLQSSFWSCLSVIIFHHLPSTLLNLFTHRFNVCSF